MIGYIPYLGILLALLNLAACSSLKDTPPTDSQVSFTPVPPLEQTLFKQESKMAVVVGIDTYTPGSGFRNLEYAKKDADRLAEVLEDQGYVVASLVDHEATAGVIKRHLESLGDKFEQGKGTVVFAFAGHGFEQNGKNYLAPYEASLDSIGKTELSLETVKQYLVASGARQRYMFIDACRDAPAVGRSSVNLRSFSHVGSKITTQASHVPEGTLILFSTGSGKQSYEDPELKHGIFTHFLVEGLQGKASDHGWVTFKRLKHYVERSVIDWAHKKNQDQKPYSGGELSGDLDAFLLAGPSALATRSVAKPWYKKWWIGALGGIGVAVLAGTLLSSGGGGGEENPTVNIGATFPEP